MSQAEPIPTRTAIDCSGRIGQLYDGYRDQIFHKEQPNLQVHPNTTREMRRCEIIHGNNMPDQNLLKMIYIDDQSRLSLLLNLAEKDGITKIIDYDIPINKYNRIFRCTYVQRTQKLADEATKDLKLFTQSAATHFISEIEWGIDVAVVLQLQHNDENIQIIDRVLQNICNLLLDDGNTLSSRSDELHALKMIMDTKVYSNVNEIARMTSLLDVCTYILKRKDNCITQPILYNLRPYISLYPHSVAKDITFVPLTEPYNNNLEEYILQITTDVKRLRKTVKEDLPKLLHDDLKEQSLDARKLLSIVEGKYNEEMPRYSKLVLQIRRNQLPATLIEKELEDNRSILMKSAIQNLDHLIDELKEKGHFIYQLNEQGILYLNVVDFDIDPADKERTIERSITRDIRYDRILCSNDKLNKIDPDRFRQFRDELIKQRTTNPQLRLVYADFSYCTHNLQYMMRLPLDIYSDENTILKQHSARLSKDTSSSNVLTTKDQAHPVSTSTSFSEPYTANRSNDNRFQTTKPSSNQSYAQAKHNIRTTEPLRSEKPHSYVGQQQTPTSTTSKSPVTESHSISKTTEQSYHKRSEESQYGNSRTTLSKMNPPVSMKPDRLHPPFEGEKSDEHVPKKHKTLPNREKSSPLTTPKDARIEQSKISSLSEDKPINIVLLGETGVGKSTFINAFANYLTFNTLKQAEKGPAVVLIPVSFIITTGDNFEEHIVKFGDVKDSKNEDFENPGQSVTQQCKTHEFNLKQHNGKKLCLIDTPGFGDTRGLDQDDRNMQHILNYIKKLEHIDAICFLLRPNESRLNMFFRSCITQLFSLLGSNIGDRMIFCFTNSRSTFYSPGDTAPLLKKMLSTLSMGNVPFRKENTFCLDSESFRYLVALQNGVRFSELNKEEYEKSWSISVDQSQRLINYVLSKTHRITD